MINFGLRLCPLKQLVCVPTVPLSLVRCRVVGVTCRHVVWVGRHSVRVRSRLFVVTVRLSVAMVPTNVSSRSSRHM